MEGRGPEALGEVPAEHVPRTESAGEVRGKSEQRRGERAEGEGQVLPGSETAAAHPERERHPEEGGPPVHERPHSAGVREERVPVPATGEGGGRGRINLPAPMTAHHFHRSTSTLPVAMSTCRRGGAISHQWTIFFWQAFFLFRDT